MLLDHLVPVAATRRPDWPVPKIVTRAEWGAKESLRTGSPIYDDVVEKIVVHHTATPNSVTDYDAICRGILAYETSRGFFDIAYNWLIDPEGRIYEGRWAANYADGRPHTGESSGRNVRGAHALGCNSRTIGVALIGNYEEATPTPQMVDALVRLLAWKCARWGLDPLGRGPYVSMGGTRDIRNITGHRDVGSTLCPGENVVAVLPTVRRRVADVLAGGGYWMASGTGQVLGFGTAAPVAGTDRTLASITAVPTGRGYWLAAPDGRVQAFGAAPVLTGTAPRSPVTGIAAAPDGAGFWLTTAAGGVQPRGSARFLGSAAGLPLAAPVAGIVATPTGRGYWLFARDGGVFTFGDATYRGSLAGSGLAAPVVAMAARPQGDGYWLGAADGTVRAFGNAPAIPRPARRATRLVDLVPSVTGRGFLGCWGDGEVTAHGDAVSLGGAKGKLASAAVGIAGRVSGA
ncbi:MAG: N-acetylmuramoyl-L-alanine amidase [Actinomycetota bacterium]